MFDIDEGLVEKFWGRADRSGDCWEWSGGRSKDGYGRFRHGGREWAASRVAYFLARGVDPGGLHVLHRCDNPPCVNPDHLFLGDDLDNARDRTRKGRGTCKVDWGVVREMLRLYSETDMTGREIDDRFGYVGSAAILGNRLWYDQDYRPPSKKKGRRASVVEIFGEAKTIREWSRDPRCQVKLSTLIRRHGDGEKGPPLLERRTNKGRPPRSVIRPRKEESLRIAREMDRGGATLRVIRMRLRDDGLSMVSAAEVAAGTASYEVTPEIAERLGRMSLGSTWRCSEAARELGVPYSVVWRMRAT